MHWIVSNTSIVFLIEYFCCPFAKNWGKSIWRTVVIHYYLHYFELLEQLNPQAYCGNDWFADAVTLGSDGAEYFFFILLREVEMWICSSGNNRKKVYQKTEDFSWWLKGAKESTEQWKSSLSWGYGWVPCHNIAIFSIHIILWRINITWRIERQDVLQITNVIKISKKIL